MMASVFDFELDAAAAAARALLSKNDMESVRVSIGFVCGSCQQCLALLLSNFGKSDAN